MTPLSRLGARAVLALVAPVLILSGCANMSETQSGTAKGAGIGAAAGAAIGAVTAGGNRGRSAGTGAAVGAAVGALGGYVWSKRMEEQRQQMEQASRGTGIDVDRTQDNRIKLNIPADAGFATNRADIQPNLRTVLEKFATSMNQHAVTTIQIVGHTDATGGPQINEPLSVARANATRDFLASRGVSPTRISTSGMAERQPVASNDSEAGRAQNRRVEIYIAEAGPQG
jgi:outer membrane protein OmpA-like peptidoglycan-associated protein